MKYLSIVLAGFLAGAAVACLAVYYNPLIDERGDELGSFDWVYHYGFPGQGVLAFTHGGAAPLPFEPAGAPELWEKTIRSAAMAVVALDGGEAAPAALASKISIPSEATDFLTNGVILNDYWLLTVPGGGSLFMLGDSNVWPLMKDTVVPVTLLNRPWPGPHDYQPTEGPGLRGTALVLGATGRFEAQEGSAIERYRVNRFSRADGVEDFAGEVHLRIVDTAPDTAPDTSADTVPDTAADTAPDTVPPEQP